MRKKIRNFFRSRLGISIVINLAIAITLSIFLGLITGMVFLLGAFFGALESMLHIDFVEQTPTTKK